MTRKIASLMLISSMFNANGYNTLALASWPTKFLGNSLTKYLFLKLV
jgi:hypothetical protein